MMHQTATFPYLKTNTWQVVELPYAGERYSMVALLPQANLAQGLKGLTPTAYRLSSGSSPLPRMTRACPTQMDFTSPASLSKTPYRPWE